MDRFTKIVGDRLRMQAAEGPHPGAEALAAFTENALPASERQAILEHVAACASCREICFFALPSAAEQQKVFAMPARRPVFAWRWGTVLALAVIVVAAGVGRYELKQNPIALKRASPCTTVQQAQDKTCAPVQEAQDKAPLEVDRMRQAVPAPPSPAKVSSEKAVPAGFGRAEPKHMTAQPSVSMQFNESGQVEVAKPHSDDAGLQWSAVRDAPTQGRNAAELMKIAPGAGAGAVAGTPTAANAADADHKDAYYYQGNAPAAAKQALQFPASLYGQIVDATGASVSNAKVTVVGSGQPKTAVSGPSGQFAFSQLDAGTYSLKVEAPGFRTQELKQIAVLANKPAEMKVALSPGAVSETVEVSAAGAPAAFVDEENANALSASAAQRVSRADKEEGLKKAKAMSTTAGYVSSQPGLAIFKWSLTADGNVLRSFDRKNWQPVTVGEGAKFRAISANLADIWAGGEGGALYHSVDSGYHWTRVAPLSGTNKLESTITRIEFSDPRNGKISTAAGQLWTTADGGQSWKVQ